MSNTNVIDFHIMLDICNPGNKNSIPKGMEFMLRLFNFNKNNILNMKSDLSSFYTFGNKKLDTINFSSLGSTILKKDLREII